MLLPLGIAASTLLSEDAACVAAGLLVQRGILSPAAAVAACAAGIYVGDALLWVAGRVLSTSRWAARWRDAEWSHRAARLQQAADSPWALAASRFVPGTRLPLYLAAGAFGRKPRTFFVTTLLAVLIWTPVLVLGTSSSVLLGGSLLALAYGLRRLRGCRWWSHAAARLDRWRRPEFWPAWVYYLPVTVHIARLALRYGGLGTLSAANPGIPEGGFVGESKSAILAQLPARWTLRADLVPDGGTEARLEDLRRLIELGDHVFPLVLKPDAGQRGTGVRLVHSLDEARAYFAQQPGPVVVQRFHPGPFEAGIFYYRRPGEAHGHIFSVTDKRFPILTGDGTSTLEELIWRHPRYRLQAHVFVRRHAGALGRVLACGERFQLAIAGNHAQGTLFLDGSHLITPALERRIDEIARCMPGFWIGRFDVRYSSAAAFRRGDDLAIVELNGVTSESTNIYDPACTLFEAWRVLCRQWTLVFEIGAANRANGARPVPASRLLSLAVTHLRTASALPVSS
jgi:membrane protein DedA with SNARE-associated domain